MPKNYILLFLFTFSVAYLISFTVAVVEPYVVLLAGGITTLLILFFVLYGFFSKNDITVKTLVLFYFPLSVAVILFVCISNYNIFT